MRKAISAAILSKNRSATRPPYRCASKSRLVELRVDKPAIDEAYANLTGHLTEQDQANLARQAARMAVLVKSPDRVRRIVSDIVEHYQEKVEPNGFKAMIVTFDREACVLYKKAMDEILRPEASEIVMSVFHNEMDYQAVRPQQRGGRKTARPLPRPGRPAPIPDCHLPPADRFRRAHLAGDVPG